MSIGTASPRICHWSFPLANASSSKRLGTFLPRRCVCVWRSVLRLEGERTTEPPWSSNLHAQQGTRGCVLPSRDCSGSRCGAVYRPKGSLSHVAGLRALKVSKQRQPGQPSTWALHKRSQRPQEAASSMAALLPWEHSDRGTARTSCKPLPSRSPAGCWGCLPLYHTRHVFKAASLWTKELELCWHLKGAAHRWCCFLWEHWAASPWSWINPGK